ncbi:MAG: hypothetical protein Kow0075_15910 [Salibacteraceae bacterium]
MSSYAIVLGLLFATRSLAHEKFQVKIMLSPTIEWMHFSKGINAPAYNALFGSKFSYNFGFEFKQFFDPSLSYSTGLIYMNKGFRNEITYYDQLGQLRQGGVTLGSVHMAAVPLYLNFHHTLKRRLRLIYTIGVAGGYLISERVRNSFYSGEDVPQQGFFDLEKEGRSNVNIFTDWYLGLHTGLGLSIYLKKRIVLIVQPMYKHQINNARDYLGQFSSGDIFNLSLNSFGLDVKFGYFFTKNLRNKRKEI